MASPTEKALEEKAREVARKNRQRCWTIVDESLEDSEVVRHILSAMLDFGCTAVSGDWRRTTSRVWSGMKGMAPEEVEEEHARVEAKRERMESRLPAWLPVSGGSRSIEPAHPGPQADAPDQPATTPARPEGSAARSLSALYAKRFIQCRHCPDNSSRAYFAPGHGVVVCENHLPEHDTFLQETIVHELVHAFDYCKYEIDPSNCDHIACTEIRAATLSGECKFSRELFQRGIVGLDGGHFEACVKRRAELSLQQHPRCEGNRAGAAVHRAWERCHKDYAPWHFIPS
eukprot:TRINITY_DN3580_c0_g3_i1.p1 TRINITY_DN3580_c0_g3~~TRINITY_DN3580_c0_g3_i1.p1  ORF type:complete len:287 (+),score=68.23 TRINITY_DN3580_c0_g3_i1:140-1000(+)